MTDHNNLEEFNDPANYDLEEADSSAPRVAFYGELAIEVGGPVLEVACGSGLVTIPVAARGLDVTGVDLSRPMLDHARLKSEQLGLPIRWAESDARQLDLGTQYVFIFLTGNGFQAFLNRKDQESLLASVKRHLVLGGTFAFETRNPSGHDLTTLPDEEHWQSYTSVEDHRVTIFGTQIYDPLSQIMHWTTFRRWNDGARDHSKETHIACRFTYPQELNALLHYNGFRIVQQYGNWNKEALTPASTTIITRCTHL